MGDGGGSVADKVNLNSVAQERLSEEGDTWVESQRNGWDFGEKNWVRKALQSWKYTRLTDYKR